MILKQKILITITLIILIFITCYWYFKQNNTRYIPNQILTTITGKKISLQELNTPVLITFWATDCKSCVAEIEDFRYLHTKYNPQGLDIIAIAMYYDPPNHVVNMSRNKQIPYNVALDLQAEHARAFGQIKLTPTTFLIDANGAIKFKKIGLFDVTAMANRIETLIKNYHDDAKV